MSCCSLQCNISRQNNSGHAFVVPSYVCAGDIFPPSQRVNADWLENFDPLTGLSLPPLTDCFRFSVPLNSLTLSWNLPRTRVLRRGVKRTLHIYGCYVATMDEQTMIGGCMLET